MNVTAAYLAGLALGFLGSLHCLGMCGPIALVVPPLGSRRQVSGGREPLADGKQSGNKTGSWERSRKTDRILGGLIYGSGRVIMYSVLGLFAGLLGRGFAIFQWQQVVSVGLGILIVFYPLIPRIFRISKLNRISFGLANRIKVIISRYLKKGTTGSLLTIGLANGLLPCGFVYLGLAGSLQTASAEGGAIFMACFGIGTMPMMSAVHYIGKGFSKFRFQLSRMLPILTMALGLLFILRGMGLGIPYVSPDMNGHQGHSHCATGNTERNTEMNN